MEAAIPAGALVIGFLLALLTEWVRDGRAAHRERKRLAAEAQRQTLIELQEALLQLGRAAGSLNTARKRRFDERHEWLGSEEFYVHYEALAEARMPVITLASRVEDDALRQTIAEIRQQDEALATATGPEEAGASHARMADGLVAAIERCGELIRRQP